MGEIWRWHGTRCREGIHPRYRDRAPEILALVENRRLIRPRIAHETYAIADLSEHRMRLANGAEIEGQELGRRFAGAIEAIAAVVTTGSGLDDEIVALFADRRVTRALMMEEVGIAALFKLGDQAAAMFAREARARGHAAGGAICPGDEGLALDSQPRLVELAGAARIGVSAIASGMMRPVRSLSMVVGVGPDIRGARELDICASCQARETCRYRRVATEGVGA